MLTASQAPPIPRAYLWRRIHSLFGLWLAIFLVEHLLTNSQAALLIGDNGKGFITFVNLIKNLPYLPVIEVTLLGVPILMHAAWGIKYIFTGKSNARASDGKKPALARYGRNQAYSWQRYTAWILLVGIVAHVGFMRFYLYPIAVNEGARSAYFVRIGMDNGLYTVASRLDVQLYGQDAITNAKRQLAAKDSMAIILPKDDVFNQNEDNRLAKEQRQELKKEWYEALVKRPINEHQVIAVADNFGTATLLTVRDSFRKPITCYSLYDFCFSGRFSWI